MLRLFSTSVGASCPLVLVVLAMGGCATAPATTEPIPGSRPGLTDDAQVVPPRSIQAEAGIDVGRLGGEDFTAGELLLRLGLTPRLEARMEVESEGGLGRGESGLALEDLAVGAKLQLREGGSGFREPTVGLVPSVSFPTGADRLSSGGVEPGALLVAEWEGAALEWTANLGATAARGDEGRHGEWFLGLASGLDVSPEISVEVEAVRTLARGSASREADLRHLALGAAWLLHPDLQADGWLGLQRNSEGRGGFLGLGISVRR